MKNTYLWIGMGLLAALIFGADFVLADKPLSPEARPSLSLIGIGKDDSSHDGRDVFVDGRYAYVGGGYDTNALVIWDISSPQRPVLAARMTGSLEFARGVVVRKGIAYVSGRDSGTFVTANVTDPTKPVQLDWVGDKKMRGARGVALHPTAPYAFVAIGHLPHNDHRNAGLAVVDIHDPSDLRLVTIVTDPKITAGGTVYQIGDFLYMTGYRDHSVMVFDVKDPANPVLAGRFESDQILLARGMSSREGVLFVSSAETDSVLALDVSHAPQLSMVGILTDPRLAGARANTLSGDRLIVSARAAGRAVMIDVSDPSQMRIVDSLKHPSLAQAYGITQDGRHVYAASAETGDLVVLRIDDDKPKAK